MNSAQIGAAACVALQLQIGIVVVADPHDAKQVAGKPGEPCIMGGARLARRRGGKTQAGAPSRQCPR